VDAAFRTDAARTKGFPALGEYGPDAQGRGSV